MSPEQLKSAGRWPRLDLRGIELGYAASVYAAHDDVGPFFVNFNPKIHAAMVFCGHIGGPVALLEVELTQHERDKLMDFLGMFWTEVAKRWMNDNLGAS